MVKRNTTHKPRLRRASHYKSEALRRMQGRRPGWLRQYIGRRAIYMLVADDLLREQEGEGALSPGVRSALNVLHELAGPEDDSKMSGRVRLLTVSQIRDSVSRANLDRSWQHLTRSCEA